MTITENYNDLISDNGLMKSINVSNKYIIDKYFKNYHLENNNTSFLNPGSFYIFDYENKRNIILSAGNNKGNSGIIENAIVISNIEVMKRMSILAGFFSYFQSKYEKNISMEISGNNSVEHIIFGFEDFVKISKSSISKDIYRRYKQESIKNLKKISLLDVHYLLLVNFT